MVLLAPGSVSPRASGAASTAAGSAGASAGLSAWGESAERWSGLAGAGVGEASGRLSVSGKAVAGSAGLSGVPLAGGALSAGWAAGGLGGDFGVGSMRNQEGRGKTRPVRLHAAYRVGVRRWAWAGPSNFRTARRRWRTACQASGGPKDDLPV